MGPILSTRLNANQPLLVAILLVILAVILFIGHASANQNELVLKLLKTSGVTSQLDQIHSSIWMAVPLDAFANDTQRNEAFRRFRKVLTADYLLSIAHDQFQVSFDADRIRAVTNFFETGVGRKLARVQKDLLAPHNLKNIRESRRTAALLEGRRSELISRMIQTQRASETNSELADLLVRALLTGKSFSEDGQEIDQSDAERTTPHVVLEKNLVNETVLLSYANNLKSFDEDELLALVTFLETPEAQWFQAKKDSFNALIVQEIGQTLSDIISPGPSKGR